MSDGSLFNLRSIPMKPCRCNAKVRSGQSQMRCGKYLFRVSTRWGTATNMTHPLALPILAISVALLSTTPAAAQTEHSQHHTNQGATAMRTPMSLAAEHQELHETLARASREGGELGNAAAELERALAPHFQREEQIATPPLGLLPTLARENATTDMRAVLPMTDALERELPQMLKEHEGILHAATKFRAAAEKAGRAEYVRFNDELAAHARQEEEILYPAAVLVGRYIKQLSPEK